MRIIVCATAAFIALLGSAAAADQAVPAVKAADFAEVRRNSVDENLYFQSRENGLAIDPADSTALIKQKGRELQLALERWSIDHDLREAQPAFNVNGSNPSYYPYDLTVLLRQGYLGDLPRNTSGYYANPFTAFGIREWNSANVAPGDWTWNDTKAGNFSYVYHCNSAGYVDGYTLVFYGKDSSVGLDVSGDGQPDGIVLMLRSGVLDGMDWTSGAFWNGQPLALSF